MGSAPSRIGGSSRRRWKWLAGTAVLVLAILTLFYLRYDLRAYAVLTHFANPETPGILLGWETRSISRLESSLALRNHSIPSILYSPQGVAHPRGMLLIHGLHHLGIHDPRITNLARALAEDGFAVLTPQFGALADYHVDGTTIPEIGESAQWLEQQLRSGPVTVIGISFGGGLALLAAAEPQYEGSVRAIVSFGGYDDLERVCRFLATREEEFPDGSVVPLAAHDYGGAILVYDNLDRFFPAGDVPAAREALRRYLWEKPQTAKPWLEKLSPAGRATMDNLFARQIAPLRPQLLASIQADQDKMASLSPHGKIAGLRVPVFILHGSTDNIIPPAESLWLAREVPQMDLRGLLITSVFTHVDMKDGASLLDELRLVHFLAEVLRAAD